MSVPSLKSLSSDKLANVYRKLLSEASEDWQAGNTRKANKIAAHIIQHIVNNNLDQVSDVFSELLHGAKEIYRFTGRGRKRGRGKRQYGGRRNLLLGHQGLI